MPQRFMEKHRCLLMGLVVTLTALLVAAWAWYDLHLRVDDQPVFEIVNDTYSQTIELLRTDEDSTGFSGLYQEVQLPAEQPLYGVRVDFTTYVDAFRTGAVTATLQTADETLAVGTLECITIKDNTFAAIVFDAPYTAPTDQQATLTLAYQVYHEADLSHPLGLWASEGAVSPGGMQVFVNGKATPLDATLALQWMVDYSGRWSWVLSGVLGALLCAAVALGFALLFGRGGQHPLWAVVLAGGLLLGGAFSVATPPLVAPDEYTHLTNSYRTASRLLGEPELVTDPETDTPVLAVRPCDAPYWRSKTGDIGIFAYKQTLSHLGEVVGRQAADTPGTEVDNGAVVNRMLYGGQTLGLLLARGLGLGYHTMLLCGRLGGLLFYLLLAALAVRLAPAAVQGMFAAVALLPMPLQLAASFSADGAVLGLVFCFTALCLALRERPARHIGERLLLLVLAFAIGPAKAIYLPVVLLVLAVPREHLAAGTLRCGKAALKQGTLYKLLALGFAALGWTVLNLNTVLYLLHDTDWKLLAFAAVAAATMAAVLGLLYWKLHRDPRARRLMRRGLIAAVCVAVPVALYALTHMKGGLEPDQLLEGIQPNGDSIYRYSIGYICRNLPATVKLLLRSVSAQGAHWLQGLLGITLGEPIVYRIDVSWLLGIGLLLALLAATLPVLDRPALALGRRAKVGTGSIVLCVVALTFVAALSWTPINYFTIFGVQGRYWLPVLPLALLPVATQQTVALRRPVARQAVFAVLCLTALVILQGAGLYAAWQMS